jgi:hypothetical protein
MFVMSNKAMFMAFHANILKNRQYHHMAQDVLALAMRFPAIV